MASKNSRVGRAINDNNPREYALPRYVPGNVGHAWKSSHKRFKSAFGSYDCIRKVAGTRQGKNIHSG